MNTKFALTLTGTITVATIGLFGLSTSPVYAQSSSSQESENIRENETNTNNNNNNSTPRENDSDSPIIIQSYPNQIQDDGIYRSNYEQRLFDQSRSYRQRDYYNRLMEPYHQRHYLNRNSNSIYQYRRDYNRDYYRR